jgi:ThiF family
VLIDTEFPNSEPRIAAPALNLGEWPHVESNGVLCLRPTTRDAAPGDRVVGALNYAAEVLNLDEGERHREFALEFAAYWGHLASPASEVSLFVTLMPPESPSRELVYARTSTENRVVLADDSAMLSRWLENSGEVPATAKIRRTRLIWLNEPWVPEQFPERYSDVSRTAGDGVLNPYLEAGEGLPVLIGGRTKTGSVFVGVYAPALSRQHFKKGFRKHSTVSGAMLAAVSAGHAIRRVRVQRADPAWIHGRMHNAQLEILRHRSLAVVGCGALGAAIARLLVQAGVPKFRLVDDDCLSTANTSRHVLGSRAVGINKADALKDALQRDFPHIEPVISFPIRFQRLNQTQLAELASCDLLVSAGVDWDADVAIDRWRQGLKEPPVHLCTWAEEFALVGHALALFGDDSLIPGFSADGLAHFRLTEWPPNVRTQMVEAGCGNVFQPHGAVDLAQCVNIAAQLALDVLTKGVTSSRRRIWLGDRHQLERLGGIARPGFDVSFARKDAEWPPGES